MKITAQTTIGELDLLKAKLGADRVHLAADGLRRRAVVFHARHGYYECTADTEAEALDGALGALIQKIGTEMIRP